MKSRAEMLDEMNKMIQIASDRIRYYKQQDKMLQSEIKRLTRNARMHRLCTHGSIIESLRRGDGSFVSLNEFVLFWPY